MLYRCLGGPWRPSSVETRAFVVDFFPRNRAEDIRGTQSSNQWITCSRRIRRTHLTIVGGEFLTPFGTYNERLTDLAGKFWEPAIDLWRGDLETGSGVGGMLRGSAVSKQSFSISYAAYFSGNSANSYFGAERSSGGQGQIYFPEHGLEMGIIWAFARANSREQCRSSSVVGTDQQSVPVLFRLHPRASC